MDIAHSLSMQCRFSGHCKQFYSVAEHSVIVSLLVKPEYALYGLMHDASEAYLTDVTSPVKPELGNYHDLEYQIMGAILTRFQLLDDSKELWDDVKDADKAQLKAEAKHLMVTGGKDWVENFPTVRTEGLTPRCFQPQQAKDLFLSRFWELSKDRGVDSGLSPILLLS